MSLLFIDGFDHYATAQLTAKGWTIDAGIPVIAGGSARTGTGGVTIPNNSAIKRGVAAGDTHATLIAGCALNPSTLATGMRLFGFYGDAGATTHVSIEVSTTGAIVARRGTNAGTVLGTSSAGVVTAGAFNYVEVLVTLHDTTGVVTVKVNGATVLNLTGQDTKNAGTATVLDAILIGRTSSVSADSAAVDDFYLCNGAGSAPTNTFLGDVRVRTLSPDGNGNSSQLVGSDGNSTNNYQLVDESPPDTADYVGSVTAGDKDTYTFGNLTELTGTVFGVQRATYAAKTDAGAKSIAHVTRSAGTDYDSADMALSTSAAYALSMREQDPATSAAWAIAAVNAAEYGVKVRP